MWYLLTQYIVSYTVPSAVSGSDVSNQLALTGCQHAGPLCQHAQCWLSAVFVVWDDVIAGTFAGQRLLYDVPV